MIRFPARIAPSHCLEPIMFSSLLLSAAVVINAPNLGEADPHGFERQPLLSVKTRAQVLAELKAAQRAGLIGGEADPHGFGREKLVSTKTRAEVRAEARDAQPHLGEVFVGLGE